MAKSKMAARFAKVKNIVAQQAKSDAADSAATDLANQLRPAYPLVSVGVADGCRPGATLQVFAATKREEQRLRDQMTSAGWTHKGYPVVVKYMGKVRAEPAR